MDVQKDALKTGRLDQVLRALAGYIEPPEMADASAPVRRCHRYLSERRAYLNYPDALANGLPIGSGEIESAHRTIAQQRLKRAGAIHNCLYRVSGGRIGGRFSGAPVLLLEVRGRKSGALQTVPLLYVTTDRGFALIASFAGSPKRIGSTAPPAFRDASTCRAMPADRS